jgi:NADPH:quinone reductase-like Zn-dependent oxidoreductase
MKALALTNKGLTNLHFQTVPIPTPSASQLLIKVIATAINPVDWKMAEYGYMVSHFPLVLGTDVCGRVEAVGNQVEHIKIGDVVYLNNRIGRDHFGTFAEYCLVEDYAAILKPDELSPEQACSLPVAAATSFLALFHDGGLNLSHRDAPENRNKTVLVWGGASSVGMMAVQLLAGLNYNVVSTASGNNVDHVKRLGASHVYNYKNEGELEELKNRSFHFIFDTIGDDNVLEVVRRSGNHNPNDKIHVSFITRFTVEGLGFPSNVVHHLIGGGSYYDNKEKTDFIKECYRVLHQLIKNRKFEAPNVILFHGIDKMHEAIHKQKEGVSASKVVVKFD